MNAGTRHVDSQVHKKEGGRGGVSNGRTVEME